jgi:AAA15 family ATPase/GTPase
MTIEIHFTLDGNDIRYLMNQFNISLNDDFLHIFGEQLTIEVYSSKSSKKWEPSLLHIGRMRIYSNFQGSIFERMSSGINKPDAQWKPDFIDRSYNLHRPLSEVFDEYTSQPSSRDVKFDFGINVYDAIKNLFDDRIRSFAEFREIARDNIQQSSDRIQADLSSHLIKLRNGTLKERQRFAKIQSHFSEMFLNWDLEVRNLTERNQPQIVIVKNKEYEASQEAIGAGILESINLITYLIDTERSVFLIDEPELHLHPHAERLMSKLIKECSTSNQVICITHSPIFIDTDDIEKITIVHETAGKSNLITFDTQRVQNYSQIKEKLLSKLTSNEK